MQPRLILTTLMATLAGTSPLVSANPVPIPEEAGQGLQVLETFQVEGGNITTYGFSVDPTPADTGNTQGGCDKRLWCDNKKRRHQAKSDSCLYLKKILVGDPGHEMSKSPRDICFDPGYDGGQCCVSWSKVVPGLNFGDLVDGFDKVYKECNWNNYITGKIYGKQFKGGCADQFLSDRPKGC